MKASDFKKFIEKAKKVVPAKTTEVALELCLIQNGWAIVRNDNVQLEMKIPGLNEHGVWCVRFFELERILTKLKDAEVELTADNNSVVVASSKGQFAVEEFKAEDFDMWENAEDLELVDAYDEDDLAEIAKCINYVGDQLRPTGQQQIRSEEGKFLATNGHFLRFKQRKTVGVRAYNIPPHAAELLSEGPMSVYEVGNEFFTAAGPSCVVKARQVQAIFPTSWKTVIPREDAIETELVVDPAWLKETLSLAKLQAGVMNVCRLSAKTDEVLGDCTLTIESKDVDLKRAFKRSTPIGGKGRDITVGYKIDFLDLILKVEKPETLNLKIVSESRPTIINDYLLIMPCFLPEV